MHSLIGTMASNAICSFDEYTVLHGNHSGKRKDAIFIFFSPFYFGSQRRRLLLGSIHGFRVKSREKALLRT